jgi:hypothetical protein
MDGDCEQMQLLLLTNKHRQEETSNKDTHLQLASTRQTARRLPRKLA